MTRESFSMEMTCDLSGFVGVSNADIGENIILLKRNNKYNGSQAGTRLTCLQNSKASVARERVKKRKKTRR